MKVLGAGANFLENSGETRLLDQNCTEPNLVSVRIERMVNGYVVEVWEGRTGAHIGQQCGPRHLVTSREKLIELLTEIAPFPLAAPIRSEWGHTIEEKKW